jgi:hypothetical protein
MASSVATKPAIRITVTKTCLVTEASRYTLGLVSMAGSANDQTTTALLRDDDDDDDDDLVNGGHISEHVTSISVPQTLP